MRSPGLAFIPLLLALPAGAASAPDYLREVKPLLTRHCIQCHGAQKEEAGLRLDTAEFARLGGASGSVVKRGRDGESLLTAVIAGTHADIPAMPYKKELLSAAEIATLRAWVTAGAPAPENEEPGRWEHWAFIAPKRPNPPAAPANAAAWPRNEIDRFIVARLAADRIAPAPEADRATLLRRVSLDLTGLPPAPAETAAFLADASPDAYERAVDRLLASPHFGERWARPWLDVARYADSNGYSIDAPRQIWKYRDWVVNALNRDLPYDQFVIEQLAGDLLPNPTVDQRVATGFNRNTQINQEGGIDPEQFRVEAVLDRVNTFGTAFLGLTLSCAQCHDHKFDPITQRDYYKLYAFFNTSVDDGHGDRRPKSIGVLHFKPDGKPDEQLETELAEVRGRLSGLFEAHGTEIEAWRLGLSSEARDKVTSRGTRAALDVPWEKLSFNQRRSVYPIARPKDTTFRQFNERLGVLQRRESQGISTLVMEELPGGRPSHIFIKGDFTRTGDLVQPGTPVVLPPLRKENPNRLDLARWTVDSANPLTARVFVNRVWQQYFGRGIVETENDLGTQAAPPSHPELLDWLATELIARGWSQKALHRLIVTSATYRQASRHRPDLEVSDPLNRLLARQTRLRLDAELVRDATLAASGLLVPKLGGPPVFPPQPEGVMSLGQVKREWKPSTGDDRHRRGLYTHFWRATPHPALAVFDAADGFSSCSRRLRSNTPLQALTLLNDQQFFEFAGGFADRIRREAPARDLAARIDFAFRCAVARSPSAFELERVSELHRRQFMAAEGTEEERDRAAWLTIARVLLNLDETITRE